MQAVGFHFGHDASCARVAAGGLQYFMDKERRSRVKHALGLSSADIRQALDGVGDDLLIGLSSTQEVPILTGDDVHIEVDGAPEVTLEAFVESLGETHYYRQYMAWMGDGDALRGPHVRESMFPYFSRLNEGFQRSYDALGSISSQFGQMSGTQHRAGVVQLDGRRCPARFYQHHFLHAQYAAWSCSPDRPALIITSDGGIGPSFFGGGVYFWTPGTKLLPVTPIDGWLGEFYDKVSEVVGFKGSGGAGKLMGLAPYGRPIYFDGSLVGTRHEVTRGYDLSMRIVVERWLSAQGVDSNALPTWDLFSPVPPVIIADIAASAQLVLERNLQELGRAAVRMAQRGGFQYETILLCGGVALNCPANSNLAMTLDKPVMVPPAVNDEGLSIGAAVAAYFDHTQSYPAAPADYAQSVYIGTDVSEADVEAAARRHGWRRIATETAVDATAELLLADVPVGLCTGKAEVGPRALGHRSLLINPASVDTWAAANRIKRREPWRPFAPAVLLEDSAAYFDRGPPESRFMLFNYRCNTKTLPAITHYDHSARVQHVSAETGLLHDVLVRLKARGAAPVVLNTSFNGPPYRSSTRPRMRSPRPPGLGSSIS